MVIEGEMPWPTDNQIIINNDYLSGVRERTENPTRTPPSNLLKHHHHHHKHDHGDEDCDSDDEDEEMDDNGQVNCFVGQSLIQIWAWLV